MFLYRSIEALKFRPPMSAPSQEEEGLSPFLSKAPIPTSSHKQETLWLETLACSLILPATSVPLPCARRFLSLQPLSES